MLAELNLNTTLEQPFSIDKVELGFLKEDSLGIQSLQFRKPSKKPTNPASMTFDEYRQQGLDWFEKLIERLQKPENSKEALVVGMGFTFIGLVMTFAGS